VKTIFFIPVWLFLKLHGRARTIPVGRQHIIKTIQQALVIAANGDTILVEAGHYHEKNLMINKTIFLLGPQPARAGW
jgi:nitrous oxidase accessory protein